MLVTLTGEISSDEVFIILFRKIQVSVQTSYQIKHPFATVYLPLSIALVSLIFWPQLVDK